jgi:membrane-associated phospholipid phosphatase
VRFMKTLAIASALASWEPSVALAQSDSVKASQEPLFTMRDAAVAAAFVGGMVAAFPLDRQLARSLRDSSKQAIEFAKNAADALNWLGTPGTLVIGGLMYAGGRWVFKKPELADLGLHGTEAVAAGLVATLSLKNFVGRGRPRVHEDDNYKDPFDFQFGRGFKNEDYRSFPSGHTTMGFAAAAAVTAESKRWWPKGYWLVAPVMYGGATLIGVARMYTDNHWASDVMGGAALGSFAGWKVVRYHHTHPGNRIDRWLLATSVRPDGYGGVAVIVDLAPLLDRRADTEAHAHAR